MRTLVVADDDPSVRLLIRTALEGPGYRILEAEDGAAALTLCERESPDAVILDRMMPGATGPEVVRALRRNPATAAIPVIIVTIVDEETPWEGTDLEVAAYLVKPFSPLHLRKTLERVLGKTLPAPEPAVFDAARLMARVEGDRALACELVEMFLEDCHHRLPEIGQALGREELFEVERIAHAMKGSAGVLAAAATMEAAQRLEASARAGDVTGAREAWEGLTRSLARLEPALNLLLARKAS